MLPEFPFTHVSRKTNFSRRLSNTHNLRHLKYSPTHAVIDVVVTSNAPVPNEHAQCTQCLTSQCTYLLWIPTKRNGPSLAAHVTRRARVARGTSCVKTNGLHAATCHRPSVTVSHDFTGLREFVTCWTALACLHTRTY